MNGPHPSLSAMRRQLQPRLTGPDAAILAGVALLGVVIVGAIATLVRFRAGWSHLAPALVFALLLIAESASVGWSI